MHLHRGDEVGGEEVAAAKNFVDIKKWQKIAGLTGMQMILMQPLSRSWKMSKLVGPVPSRDVSRI